MRHRGKKLTLNESTDDWYGWRCTNWCIIWWYKSKRFALRKQTRKRALMVADCIQRYGMFLLKRAGEIWWTSLVEESLAFAIFDSDSQTTTKRPMPRNLTNRCPLLCRRREREHRYRLFTCYSGCFVPSFLCKKILLVLLYFSIG